MAIRAVVFDLFDTLVDLSMHGLPRVEIGGRSVPSTAGALHEVVANHSDVDFERFIAALTEVDRAFRETRYAQGLELPTLERFEAVVDRLGIDAPELPGVLTETPYGNDSRSGQRSREPRTDSRRPRAPGAPGSLLELQPFSDGAGPARRLRVSNGHLDALVISDAIGIRKPRAEIFEAVLGELGVAPEETLHVGDNLSARYRRCRSTGHPHGLDHAAHRRPRSRASSTRRAILPIA